MKNSLLIFTIFGLITAAYLSYAQPMMQDRQMRNMMNDGVMEDMMEQHMEEHMELHEDLASLSGEEFDKAFLKEMIFHHEGAVDMAEMALERAEHQEIKDMANDIIEIQNREISLMKEWLKEWE
jgi:uncharacterized protein (DUF305 family)